MHLILSLCLFMGNTLDNKALKSPVTEIAIIGTIHNPSEKYSIDILVDIFRKVNPQVILCELDSSFFTSSFELLEACRKSQEGQAVTKFQSICPKIIIRPYDIEGRNKFYEQHNYFKLEEEFNNKMDDLYTGNKLDEKSDLVWQVIGDFTELEMIYIKDSPEVINSAVFDSLIKKRHFYMFNGQKKLVEINSELHPYKDYVNLDNDFWIKRNDAMVSNIIHFSKEFAGKKIVVICGCEHRYYLRGKLLEKQKDNNFVLREYWEIE